MLPEIRKNVRYNIKVNVLDGAFFGFALGFASFVTVIPLFIKTLTSSALLFGLISAIHSVGWQLPQLLTADRVAGLRRYKPMVIVMTLLERVPFPGLMLVAYFADQLGATLALSLTFVLLIIQGLGGGLTATAWQSMIGKIIPPERRGTFYGVQSAAANLLASAGAFIAGRILATVEAPLNFTLCFLLASICMGISWSFLARTREPEGAPIGSAPSRRHFWSNLAVILRRDTNFRWFLITRMIAQLVLMSSAFFTVHIVQRFSLDTQTAGSITGTMTMILMISMTGANLAMGWLGDRFGHLVIMKVGAVAGTLCALLAWLAPSLGWYYLVFALSGIGNTAFWTTALAITLDFGTEAERPAYIGLSNSLIAPSTLLAPLLGGWLADLSSPPNYNLTFIMATLGGIATTFMLQFLVRDPRFETSRAQAPAAQPAGEDGYVVPSDR